MSGPDHDALMMEHLARELEPYGIGADRIAVDYVEDWQDYDILISGGPLTEAQIDGLVRVSSKGGCFRFTDDRNTGLLHDALGRKGRELMVAAAAEARLKHPDLPRFDRSSQTLTDFLRALEVWAGVEPGSCLIMAGPDVVRVEHQPGHAPDLDLLGRLMIAINVLVDEDVDVLAMGQVAEGDR